VARHSLIGTVGRIGTHGKGWGKADLPSSGHVRKVRVNSKSIFVEYGRSIRSERISTRPTRSNPVGARDSGRTSCRTFGGVGEPETKRSALGRRQPTGEGIGGIPRVDKIIRQTVEASKGTLGLTPMRLFSSEGTCDPTRSIRTA